MESVDQTLVRQKVAQFANSEHAKILPELFKECRTPIQSIIGKDEFQTLVNAITIEVETKFISNILVHLQQVKEGKMHGKK